MNFDLGWLFSQFAQTVVPGFVPILVACAIAFWPGARPNRKLLFVIVSAALSLGIPSVIYTFLTPFEFHLIYIEPTLQDHGHQMVPDFVVTFYDESDFLFLGITAILSVVVPLYLRSRVWPKVFV